jgi:hypothetical protein
VRRRAELQHRCLDDLAVLEVRGGTLALRVPSTTGLAVARHEP